MKFQTLFLAAALMFSGSFAMAAIATRRASRHAIAPSWIPCADAQSDRYSVAGLSKGKFFDTSDLG